MVRIVSGIATLHQHRETLGRAPDAYRPAACPHGGLGGLWSHGGYQRKADRAPRSLENPVPIPRFLCRGCQRTCSRLPACIAPRRWYDWATIARSQHFAGVITDRAVAVAVAQHKSFFFIEKNVGGTVIDYASATQGHLRIVPEGEAREALAADYEAMLADGVMVADAPPFDQLMQACAEIQARANEAAVSP